MQPQGHVQVVLALLDDDATPQEALDRPRLCIEPFPAAQEIALEHGVPAATEAALRARGHAIVSGVTGFDRSRFGRGQIIRREPDGRLAGGSDLRGDGCTGEP
jgi:gamma-glutamyltranspeptidase/glutathione hydrolase